MVRIREGLAVCALIIGIFVGSYVISVGYAEIASLPELGRWLVWLVPALAYLAYEAYSDWELASARHKRDAPLTLYCLALMLPLALANSGPLEDYLFQYRVLGFAPAIPAAAILLRWKIRSGQAGRDHGARSVG